MLLQYNLVSGHNHRYPVPCLKTTILNPFSGNPYFRKESFTIVSLCKGFT